MTENQIPQLTTEEVRVLGALIEKSFTTPDYYPLTLNGLVTACNQKSSRKPVVNYDNDTVMKSIDSLKRKLLVASVTGDGRTIKYRHTIAVKYPLDPAEVTVLGLLFLRGPLTIGEIKNNSGRMYPYDDLQEVLDTLTQLMAYDSPFVQLLPKASGQKESRYAHCFATFEETSEEKEETDSAYNESLEQRVTQLEEELRELKEKLKDLL